MTYLDKYLNELFGWKKSHIETPSEKSYSRGISIDLQGAEEVGNEIVQDVESYRDDLMRKELSKKCSRIQSGSIDKSKCEMKIKIDHTKLMIRELQNSMYKCPNETLCWKVITNKIREYKKDLDNFNDELRNLEKIR